MLDIELSKTQTKIWEKLKEGLSALEKEYENIPKFNYDRRYDLLLKSEKEWSSYSDKVSGKNLDLSIKTGDFEGQSDIEQLDDLNANSDHTQMRRDIMSHEKIRAIKNTAKWKRLHSLVKALQEQMEAFWLATDEIKRQRSVDIRKSELLTRTKGVFNLRNKVEVYFKEGKHRDFGESLSYEYAIQESLVNLDSKRDVIKSKRFGLRNGD